MKLNACARALGDLVAVLTARLQISTRRWRAPWQNLAARGAIGRLEETMREELRKLEEGVYKRGDDEL